MLLDGAMGTMLQRSGMKPGTIPETLNITDPEMVAAIHRAYFRAGSRIVYANTFGANSLKLKGTGYSVREIVAAGVRTAKACAEETGGYVGLDVGPLGVMVEPMGSLPFEEAVNLYKEMMAAGAEAGADMIAIETMSDLAETRAAVLAAKEATDLPVFVTMSFDGTGRTFTGCTPASMARTMEGLGADAVGVNCSLGPREMIPIIREIRENTKLPVIAKPNAGLPDPVTGEYGVDAAEFAADMRELAVAGARIVGGCCGTDPSYISALAEMIRRGLPAAETGAVGGAVCTGPVCLRTDRIRVIGERINPTGKKRMQQALLEDDIDYLVEMAIRQADAGADLLDVNVGYPGVDEVRMLPRAVQAIQAAVDLPLQLDTTNPEALEAALRVCHGKAAVNSVNGKEESLSAVLPLVKKYGAAVVGLTLDGDGIPDTAEKRLAIAERILTRAEALGIPREDVWIDCLTLTVSAQQEQAAETLKAVRLVTEKLGLRTVLGVSNISFGLPNRLLVTQAFLASALEAGLTMPIVNPNQKEIMDLVAARRVLCGEDENCRAYVERFAEEAQESKPAAPAAAGMTLGEAIRRGLRKEAGRLTQEAMQARSEMEIVEQELIPALEKTGEGYEQGKVFLPQLLSAAQAAQSAFEEIRASLLKKGEKGAERGELIMATVQGDIHDIGKNIVITVLENYGYRVRDLGRDVPPETVVKETAERGIRLVGLSALMTTTLPAMEETVRQLKKLPDPPQVMVGGAVVTEGYARAIGADYYAKDVRDAVKITGKVFGK